MKKKVQGIEKKWAYTTMEHSCQDRTFKVGTRVRVVGYDTFYGFDIQDEHGNRINEIGHIL